MSLPLLDRHHAKSFFRYFQTQIDLHKNRNSVDLRRCKYTPDIVYLNRNQKIYAIGDLHGDFEVLYYGLLKANLIDENGRWTGGSNILIQLGDMFDGKRNAYAVPYAGEKKILNLLKNLHLQAIEKGGMVITMLGNHDVYRLLYTYDERGYGNFPNKDNYYLELNNDNYTGIDESGIGHVSSFMSEYNALDFSKNKSLSNLTNPNQYLDEENGFHRQLLASCSTKLLLKVVWEDSNTGVLCSHGEKYSDFMISLKKDCMESIRQIRDKYNFTIDKLIDELDRDNDLFIILINSLFSYALRVYRNTKLESGDIFGSFVVSFLNKISKYPFNNSFLWCYVSNPPPLDKSYVKNLCKETSNCLSFFDLDPRYSSSLSGHSGPLSTGIIKLNANGWCHDFVPQPQMQPPPLSYTDSEAPTEPVDSREVREIDTSDDDEDVVPQTQLQPPQTQLQPPPLSYTDSEAPTEPVDPREFREIDTSDDDEDVVPQTQLQPPPLSYTDSEAPTEPVDPREFREIDTSDDDEDESSGGSSLYNSIGGMVGDTPILQHRRPLEPMPPIHDNTIVMTDVTASFAFGGIRYPRDFKRPQLAEITCEDDNTLSYNRLVYMGDFLTTNGHALDDLLSRINTDNPRNLELINLTFEFEH